MCRVAVISPIIFGDPNKQMEWIDTLNQLPGSGPVGSHDEGSSEGAAAAAAPVSRKTGGGEHEMVGRSGLGIGSHFLSNIMVTFTLQKWLNFARLGFVGH